MLKPYQIRIDQKLLDQVRASAEKNERSVNGEIRHILRQKLDKK